MKIRGILALALIFFIILFTIQNATVVTINFLFWKISISRALMIFFVFAIGMLAGWSASAWIRHQHLAK